jgi:sugar/nucleoside kinase (ribokinase family)
LVIVVGDVMVDVVVLPLGPLNRGSDTASRIVLAPGGSASNQAVALAAAGARVHLVGVVGDDELGQAAARSLAAAGVEVHLRPCPGRSTGMVVAMVEASGERSMFTDRGANLCLEETDVAPDRLRLGGHLHLSGYELLDEVTRPAARAAWQRAAAAGMTRSVDLCSAGPLAAVGAEAFLRWTAGAEWCCANLDEGRALTGRAAPEEVLAGLRGHYREVVLSLGTGGALWAGPGAEVVHCPAAPAVVADTTGAGDALTGTFLAHRLRGTDPDKALAAALQAASQVVAAAGARRWR